MTIQNMPTFSNPRHFAEFDNWPIGSGNRGNCHFAIETTKRGSRMTRRTTDKHGHWCKPKATTYFPALGVCVVDGSDGKTYWLGESGSMIYIGMSDLHHQFGTVWESSQPELFAQLKQLLLDAIPKATEV